jgi:2-oxoisovalerate dehydrogenase E1 component
MTTVLETLNETLKRCLSDERVYLLGEDILDPYGGAFKVSRGLSDAFPDKVLTTPVSEAGISGVAIGMALRGLRPVVEIMFGDFSTLIADQLINSAAKFRWMFGEEVLLPLVIRAPMGGRRSYGPTHSQTLEKLYLGIPGLHVLAPAALGDPGALLRDAILIDDDPVLFIENKLLYLLPILDPAAQGEFIVSEFPPPDALAAAKSPHSPTYRLELRGAPPPVLTVAAYGYMADLARQAALRLAYDHEIFIELIVPTRISPHDPRPIRASITRTGRLLVVEEGSLSFGWGSEVLAQVAEIPGQNPPRTRRLGADESPVPSSPVLEEAALPGVEDILLAAKEML